MFMCFLIPIASLADATSITYDLKPLALCKYSGAPRMSRCLFARGDSGERLSGAQMPGRRLSRQPFSGLDLFPCPFHIDYDQPNESNFCRGFD
jgi:hypothetical protein